jgi:hypothetical protein
MDLKEKGNHLFKEGDYPGAEALFSQACVSLPPIPQPPSLPSF